MFFFLKLTNSVFIFICYWQFFRYRIWWMDIYTHIQVMQFLLQKRHMYVQSNVCAENSLTKQTNTTRSNQKFQKKIQKEYTEQNNMSQHQTTMDRNNNLPQKTTLGANKIPWINKIPGASQTVFRSILNDPTTVPEHINFLECNT